MVKSLIFFVLIIIQTLGQATEDLCQNNLRELEKSVYNVKPSIISPSSSSFIEERLSFFFSILPDTLISCTGVFEYNLQSSVSGIHPDLNSITGCKTGYTQFIDQVRRIAKVFTTGDIGKVSIASERLSVIRSIMSEKCFSSLGP